MATWLTDFRLRGLGLALVAVSLAVLPFALAEIGGVWVRLLNLACLFALLSLGLNIVVGFAGLLDLGYVAFYAVGAYVYAFLASPHFGIHWPVWAILPLGALAAAFFGVVLGAPTLKLRGDYLAIVTLGFGEIVRITLNNLADPINITNGPQGISLIDPVKIGSIAFNETDHFLGLAWSGPIKYYYLLLALLLISILVGYRLHDSRIGRAWEAIREDESAAKACGINTRNIKLTAFAVGASFGGIAGGLYAAMQAFISPSSFVLVESVMVLCMVVLGGMGSIPGVIVGAFLLTFVPEWLRSWTPPLQQALLGKVVIAPELLRMLLFGVALVVCMRFMPRGLIPARRRLHLRQAPTRQPQ